MKKYRKYTNEFKQELVALIDSGQKTVAQAAREHDISPSLTLKSSSPSTLTCHVLLGSESAIEMPEVCSS